MYYTLDLLRRNVLVKNLDVTTFINDEDIQVLSARATLTNRTTLFVRELATETDSKYSYHWQTSRGKLICRWDNAPHHPNIATFPHHKHEGPGNTTRPSGEVTLQAVLSAIEQRIKT